MGDTQKEARKTLSEACLLASLAWLGLEHGVKRVHFTSYSPTWEEMSADEIKKHCGGAAKKGELWLWRSAYLLGHGPHSWKKQLSGGATKTEHLSQLHMAGQHKLRSFYGRLVVLGDGSVLDAAASGLLREEEVQSVPVFGTDECFLPVVHTLLKKSATSVPAAVKKSHSAAASYSHVIPLRMLALVREMEKQGKRQWVYALQPKAVAAADRDLAKKAVLGGKPADEEAVSAAMLAGIAGRAAAAWAEELEAGDWKESLTMQVTSALRDAPNGGFFAVTAGERL